MIIDCHGHYTTAPAAHTRWRADVLAAGGGSGAPFQRYPYISDDELRETLIPQQLRLAVERGIDLTLFSPRASAMGHHEGDPQVSVAWTQVCNDLIRRVAELFPTSFAPVGQLPQFPGEPVTGCVAEVRRCVEMGFVGFNLNPDPSGGHWTSPALTDPYWFPLYDVLVELDVPAMVHVSASCNPAFHATGAHYINADTTAFMQLMEGNLFGRYPNLRLVIPHGGGAVPYHWGRYRGLADMLGQPPVEEHLMDNVFFDTCVYHQPGIDLLTSVISPENILFGSEVVGAVRGVDPRTGHHFDDTLRHLRAAGLEPDQLDLVLGGNARRVYPRIQAPATKR